MPKMKKYALIFFVAVVTLIIFVTAILPLIVRSKAIAAITAETGRKVRIEKVAINPFTLTVTVSGFAIEAQNGDQFVSVAKLRASLGLASIFKRALIISELSAETPAISVTRLAANSYSFNDIIERQNAKPKKPDNDKKGFRFSVNNIQVKNGTIDFDDRAVNGGRKHTVRKLDVAIPFISNIPYLVDKYTDPHISALINDAPFSFYGKTKPLSKSLETSVHIDLKGLRLPEYVAYSPVKPTAEFVSGKLTVNADVIYRICADKDPELDIKGIFRLDNITANLKGGAPLVKLPLLQVNATQLEIFAKRFLIESIKIEEPELFVSRSAKGEWMYSHLLPQTIATKRGSGAEKETKQDAGNVQPLVQVASFTLANGTVHFTDTQPAGGFRGTASNIDTAVKNFTTESGKTADFELSMLLDKGTSLSADGTFSPTPLTATVSTKLNGLKLQRGWPYLSSYLTAPIKGTIDLAAKTNYNKDDGLTVMDGTLSASGISARYGIKDGFDLYRFEITGTNYNQKKNMLAVGEAKLSKGDIALSREADGTISILSLLKKSPSAAENKPPAKGQQGGKELYYSVKKISINKLTTSFTDKTKVEKPRFVLSNSTMSLANLNGPKFTPAALRFTSTFNKNTPLKAVGNITTEPFRYKGSLSIGHLPLRDFEAYFPSDINVFLVNGSADTSMNVDIAFKNDKLGGTFNGSAGIRGFHAVDTVAEEDLLKWESLQLDGIKGDLEPFSLTLREIALSGVYSRIIIRKDGTLNLQNLLKKDETQVVAKTPTAVPPVQSTASGKPQPEPAKKQIRIDAITIQDGTISFEDNHLPQQFSTTFKNLGGRISGLSSEDTKFANVDLRGNLETHSPLRITGQINPLRGDLFVDLKIAFQDIELTPITPYTGAFLGYSVEKGKLNLDLTYKIDKKQLHSDNKIFIDQFTFGKEVESKQATSLPVKLGLALLKDRNGEIHLDVPVTGRTDDPKFSVWKLVWQVIQNLMVKAATSPLSLLSSMFGGGEDFSSINFAPGTSALLPSEEQKLTTLSKALLDRPALKIELKGYVDRDRDAEAYRLELLKRKLRNEKVLALGKAGALKTDESGENVTLTPEEQTKYLESLYKKEKFPKPRNAIGLVKALPPNEMKKLIIANTIVGLPELQTLARERVAAVVTYLVTNGQVPAERIFQKNDDVFKAPEKESGTRSRVELNAIAQ